MAGLREDSPTSGEESFYLIESSLSSPHIGIDSAQLSDRQTLPGHPLPNRNLSSEPPAPPPQIPNNAPRMAENLDPWAHFTLGVGEFTYLTSKHTLAKARFFRKRFEPGGSLSDCDHFFLDRDPSAFCYILQFLREGLFPVLHSAQHGFDELTYLQIAQQANFLGIPRLFYWISNKEYLQSVCLDYNNQPMSTYRHDRWTVPG